MKGYVNDPQNEFIIHSSNEIWSRGNSFKSIKNTFRHSSNVGGLFLQKKKKNPVLVCFNNMWCSSSQQEWTAAIDVHLFFLIRKLPPVLHGAVIATVILVSATREIAP